MCPVACNRRDFIILRLWIQNYIGSEPEEQTAGRHFPCPTSPLSADKLSAPSPEAARR
jgi:hypothetical protein